jgi:hypothetical protein
MRNSAFPTTLFYYRHYMSLADRHEDAYEYLTGLRPDILGFPPCSSHTIAAVAVCVGLATVDPGANHHALIPALEPEIDIPGL